MTSEVNESQKKVPQPPVESASNEDESEKKSGDPQKVTANRNNVIENAAVCSRRRSVKKDSIDILALDGESAIPAIMKIVETTYWFDVQNYGLDVIKKIKEQTKTKSQDDANETTKATQKEPMSGSKTAV